MSSPARDGCEAAARRQRQMADDRLRRLPRFGGYRFVRTLSLPATIPVRRWEDGGGPRNHKGDTFTSLRGRLARRHGRREIGQQKEGQVREHGVV